MNNNLLPMITSTLEASRRVMTSTRLAQLRHDVTLVDGPGLIGHGVDVLSGLLPAQRHVFVRAPVGAGLAGRAPRAAHGAAAQVLGLRHAGRARAATTVRLPLHVALTLTDVHTLLWRRTHKHVYLSKYKELIKNKLIIYFFFHKTKFVKAHKVFHGKVGTNTDSNT